MSGLIMILWSLCGFESLSTEFQIKMVVIEFLIWMCVVVCSFYYTFKDTAYTWAYIDKIENDYHKRLQAYSNFIQSTQRLSDISRMGSSMPRKKKGTRINPKESLQ